MSAKAIREATGKELINKYLEGGNETGTQKSRFASVTESTDWSQLVVEHPWLESTPLVVKPDQLIKRRGKLGLIAVNKNFQQVKQWVNERMGKDQKIGNAVGKLRNFIIEPFVPHKDAEEAYVCIYSHRTADTILFYHQGGVDIGDVDSKALKLEVTVGSTLSMDDIEKKLLTEISAAKKPRVAKFVYALYQLYVDLYFTYLEINPLVVTDNSIYILDLAAKIDATADFICRPKWGDIEYPPPFGRDAYPEEAYIADLDAKSGASLKLTILNRTGRIWTMVAGGGASVIYSDTICDYGGASELANYGEYSGAPSEQQTYEYAKTILNLMTSSPKHPEGKVLIIGGGIANFTNVAATFSGIITALREFMARLVEHQVSVFVRRAGPNYQEGLRRMREIGATLGIPLYVFGPETHMTAICGMALGKKPIPNAADLHFATANFLLPSGQQQQEQRKMTSSQNSPGAEGSKRISISSPAGSNQASKITSPRVVGSLNQVEYRKLFSKNTKAIVWGMQTRAVQSMLDFDFICRREEASVAAMVYPFTGYHRQKFYWGHKEVLIPVYSKMADALNKHKDVDVLVNFASLRSAYESSLEVVNDFP